MRLLTAIYDDPARGFKPYVAMVENLRCSAARVGYALDIEKLQASPTVYANPRYLDCSFKPFVIRRALQARAEDLCWVDADCLVRARFDEILADADAAFTLRPISPWSRHLYDGYLNAGVMAFRHSPAAFDLIERWIRELPRGRSDQDAMNRVLLEHDPLQEQEAVFAVGAGTVRIVPTQVYNCFHLDGDWSAAKILHFKGAHRPAVYDRIARVVLGEDAVPTATVMTPTARV